ncbi:hypothetical protein QBC36DRAFT_363412 [Triangularia setosa]|uniref:Uncharacterized protein n=1 Tax=Triangularia setosa TaxID=2587417 RepID=A0AAN6WFR8_9PEZI|nr:hypothetical protein QBC36DRAFT_363412 [Podospora setosa]
MDRLGPSQPLQIREYRHAHTVVLKWVECVPDVLQPANPFHPTVLLNALNSIQANHERKGPKIPCFLQGMLKNLKMDKSKQNPGYVHQGLNNDRLFKASCDHVPEPDYRGCDTANEIQRDL